MRNSYLRVLSLLILLCAFCGAAQATHYRGGEVSYRWMGGNTYQVSFVIYADCRGGDAGALSQDLPVFCSVFTASGTRISADSNFNGTRQDLPVNVLAGCFHETANYCGKYAVAQRTINLAPNADGYVIVNQRCCMPATVANIADPGSYGLTLSCVMPGTNQIGTGSNSSPSFKTLPPLRLCVNTPLSVDFGAVDADGDSLVYSFAPGYQGGSAGDAKPFASSINFTPLSYAPSFSYAQPLGKNGTLSLNTNTGMLSGISGDVGSYLVSVSCDEYRAGQKIGTITRAFVIDIYDCHRETTAMIQKDSAVANAGLDTLTIARCGGDRTVSFRNLSTGAAAWHWDFGVAGVDTDTSSLEQPAFTYPAAGYYPVTLVAYGANCNDTFRGTALLSDDVLQPDFRIDGGSCLLDTLRLTDISNTNGSIIAQHLWQNGSALISGDPARLVLADTGLLRIRHTIVSEHGCVAAIDKTISVRQGDIHAGNDTAVVLNSTVYLSASGGTSYNWQAIPPAGFDNYMPGAATQQIFTKNSGKDFIYVVTGKDAQGCGGRDTVRVTISAQGYVFVPTAFSPNGDGHNDFLKGKIAGYTFLSFNVYNRRGNEVFSTTNSQIGWDGRYKGEEAAMDTYYWMLRVKSPTSGSELVFSSDVMLVR